MKEKKFVIKSINYALFQTRNQKKITLKEAAKALKVTRLYLSLIEKGYVHVSKKLQPRFIDYYKLNKDFFNKNTTYVTPVNVKYEDPHVDEKIRANIKKKRTKLVSGIVSGLLLITLGMGVYFYERDNVNPKVMWSNEFTDFRQEVIQDCLNPKDEHRGVRESVEYPGDIEYFVQTSKTCELVFPEKDQHASDGYVYFSTSKAILQTYAYNQKKIGIIKYRLTTELTADAVFTYMKFGEYSMPKIIITDERGTETSYYPESSEYQEFYNILFGSGELFSQLINKFNDDIKATYKTPYTFENLMNDTQVISSHKEYGFRLGFRMMLISSVFLILSLSIFIFALIKGRKVKLREGKAQPYVVHKTEYTADAALVYRSVPNDSSFPMIIPECVLRILALGALLLSSIGVVWLTQASLVGLESSKEALELNAYVSNLLVTGMALAFFLKLDVYHKRSNKELLENIVMLFVFGLIFYVAECIVYASLTSQGTIYSELIKLFTAFIPGNIIWNLMLYSLIFFFLFTVPKSIEDTPHKVLIWRLGSIIPVLLLLTAFVVKGSLQDTLSPYVNFLFHTNGALLTAFAIFYLYALFFFQQYVSLKYGKDFGKLFLDSRRYALCKNIIACVVIFVLSLIDLLFYFKLPFNSLNLGTNWIIAGLIPFILFYHPHIGKRAPKWDLAYNVMYVIFLIGGYLISFSMISNSLDLSQISQIIS
ncbi:MAG: helix-turn-helix domain-containing protein [Bacilli bacterium]|nr:helix-turn-helix domain-containing protein [Bacilli bacterium]